MPPRGPTRSCLRCRRRLTSSRAPSAGGRGALFIVRIQCAGDPGGVQTVEEVAAGVTGMGVDEVDETQVQPQADGENLVATSRTLSASRTSPPWPRMVQDQRRPAARRRPGSALSGSARLNASAARMLSNSTSSRSSQTASSGPRRCRPAASRVQPPAKTAWRPRRAHARRCPGPPAGSGRRPPRLGCRAWGVPAPRGPGARRPRCGLPARGRPPAPPRPAPPPPVPSSTSAATCSASRDLPIPPGPAIVTSRDPPDTSDRSSASSADSDVGQPCRPCV